MTSDKRGGSGGSAPADRLPRCVASARRTFALAAVAFVLTFASAGAPVPFYEILRAETGLTAAQLALGAVAYFAGTLGSLLVAGRLSDVLGRRPVVIAALGFAVVGTLAMTAVHAVGILVAARILQGIASGLAASSIGAYVFDNAAAAPRWLPAGVTGSGATLGIPLGALLSGALLTFAPQLRALPFVVLALLLAACAVAVFLSPETSPRRGHTWASLRPRLSAPRGSGRLLLAVSAALVGTWSIGGFYQAFAPTITARDLGSSTPLVAAAVFASVIVGGPLGGPLAGRLGARRSVRWGTLIFLLTVAGAFVALRSGAIVPFVICSLASSVMLGAVGSGANQTLMRRTPPERRGGMLSTIYAISYSGAGLPALAAGSATGVFELSTIFGGYVVLIAVSAVATWVLYPRR